MWRKLHGDERRKKKQKGEKTLTTDFLASDFADSPMNFNQGGIHDVMFNDKEERISVIAQGAKELVHNNVVLSQKFDDQVGEEIANFESTMGSIAQLSELEKRLDKVNEEEEEDD